MGKKSKKGLEKDRVVENDYFLSCVFKVSIRLLFIKKEKERKKDKPSFQRSCGAK